ncbi:MAG: hypothetical protein KDD89_03200 [Anaerolineales bacterium]|nr:hypothetical protein [Anaerolineales bacterium]
MRGLYNGLSSDELLKAVLRETKEPLHTIDHLTSFLLDPSAGPLTQHQKSVVMKIVHSTRDIEHFLSEVEVAFERFQPTDESENGTKE